MKRTLTFTDDPAGRARYEVCLCGMFLQGNRQPSKSLEQKRREGRVLDALEGLGIRPADLPRDSMEFRELTPGGGAIPFEAPEFELLKAYIAEAPFPASPFPYLPSARQAMKVHDWLETIPVDPDPKP